MKYLTGNAALVTQSRDTNFLFSTFLFCQHWNALIDWRIVPTDTSL